MLAGRIEQQVAIPSRQRPTPLWTLQTVGLVQCTDAAAAGDRRPLTSRGVPSYETVCSWTGPRLATAECKNIFLNEPSYPVMPKNRLRLPLQIPVRPKYRPAGL